MHPQNEIEPKLKLLPRPRSVVVLKNKLGQRSTVFALLVAIIVLDQTAKWWAWRHVSTACVNVGGDVLVGAKVSDWYADPVRGSLLDLLDLGVLTIAISVLWRRRPSLGVLITACMMIGGWSSNLLDRLGMHDVTAPGSARGAVDFIPISPHYYNIADFFIIGGTPLFVLAVSAVCLRGWAGTRRATSGLVTPSTHDRRRARTRISAFASAFSQLAVVAVGATDDRE